MDKLTNVLEFGAEFGVATIAVSLVTLTFSLSNIAIGMIGLYAGYRCLAKTYNACVGAYDKFKNRKAEVPRSEKEGLNPNAQTA